MQGWTELGKVTLKITAMKRLAMNLLKKVTAIKR
jgi:hypothetical protein